MANLLASPENWEKEPGIPADWNGSAFVLASDEATLADRSIQYVGVVAPGDTFAGVCNSNMGNFIVLMDGEGAPVTFVAVGTPFSWTAIENGSLVLSDYESGAYSEYYGLQATIGQPPPPPNRVIEVRYSSDGSHNFSPWRLMDAGKTGSFLQEMVQRRLGRARHRVWEIRDTSSVANDLLAVSVQAR